MGCFQLLGELHDISLNLQHSPPEAGIIFMLPESDKGRMFRRTSVVFLLERLKCILCVGNVSRL